jgi:hypothetical protein
VTVATEHETLAPGMPDLGDYLTDGKRLVQVVWMHASGSIEVEDAATEAVTSISPHEFHLHWRVVSRRS